MSQSKYLMVVPVLGAAHLGAAYASALERNPLLVKAVTSGCLAALGSIIGQRIRKKLEGNKGEDGSGEAGDVKNEALRFWRVVASYGISGLLLAGPATHFWLNWLQHYGPNNVFAKLFLDRFLYGPVLLYAILFCLSVLQGTSWGKTRETIEKNYLQVFKANLKLYIVCQFINLNFVPLPYRTLFSSLVALCWNIYLSTTAKRLTSKSK